MRKIFLGLTVAFLISVFCGCSDSVTVITDVSSMVVMDFTAVETAPEPRLSIFMLANENIERVSWIEVQHIDSEIIWTIDNPMLLAGGNQMGAGSPFLMPPYYGGIPAGSYRVVYVDRAGKRQEAGFSLQDLSSFMNSTSDSIESLLKGLSVEKKIALFADKGGKGTLLFYDKPNEDWTSKEKIAEDNGKANSFRECLVVHGKKMLCLMPPIDLR